MTAPLPMPDDVAAMRERHVRDRAGLTTCGTCPQTWPCDAARLLALVDSLTKQHEYERLRADERAARLDAVLALCKREYPESYVSADSVWHAATGEQP